MPGYCSGVSTIHPDASLPRATIFLQAVANRNPKAKKKEQCEKMGGPLKHDGLGNADPWVVTLIDKK